MMSSRILDFYKSLSIQAKLPKGVSYMNPYADDTAFEYAARFYEKFYNDHLPRRIILGINPGRFGGGITGVPFTDPVKLQTYCGISNDLPKKTELSADFIYRMIEAYGGVHAFYSHYFIGAMCPLGFVKDGKNLNYYDIRQLQEAVEPFIIESLRKQVALGIDTKKAFCLGEGENFRYLQKLNKQHTFFETVESLPHPRFIMQYKRKMLQEYIKGYVQALGAR